MNFYFLIIFMLVSGGISETTNKKSYRLPKSCIPDFYDIWIKIDTNTNTFSGNVTIVGESNEETNSISLNYKDIKVNWENAYLLNQLGENRPKFVDFSRLDEEICRLEFENKFIGTFKLELEFAGQIRSDSKGLYSNELNNVINFVATDFEPTFARMVFPCFDEPHFKAKFKVHIYHEDKFHALSNMPVDQRIGPIKEEKNFILTIFNETLKMSTYLLAFVVSDFVSNNKVPGYLNIYTTESTIHETEYAALHAEKSIQVIFDLLECQYQLPKLDIIAIPDYPTAMENWGLIVISPIYLLNKESSNKPPNVKQDIALMISHEISHMWFGNEVTPEWWNYLWLSEGFARYFEYLLTDKIEKNWRIMDQFLYSNLQLTLQFDDKLNVYPMTAQNIASPNDINYLFNFITYHKSASVIRMFHHSFGDDIFFSSLKNYLKLRTFETTNPLYLFESFQTEINKQEIMKLPKPVKEIFESWSNNPGYPIVYANINRKLSVIELTQKRYLVNLTDDVINNNKLYYIPINIASSINANFTNTATDFWLDPIITKKIIDFDEKSEWIILNKQQTGYYRVNYNDENWLAIINELRNGSINKIHSLNRAQIIDDATNLGRTGHLNYNIIFDLLMYLQFEDDFIPWISAYGQIKDLLRLLKGSPEYGRFENFIKTITKNNYKKLTLKIKSGDHIERLHRINVVELACYNGNDECVKEAKELLPIDKLTNEVYEEIQPIIYCSSVKYTTNDDDSDNKLIDFIGELLFMGREKYISKINRLVTGLGCSKKKEIIEKMLQLSIGDFSNPDLPKIYESDRTHIFTSILTGSYIGTKMGLEFLEINYVTMEALYGNDSMKIIFDLIGPHIVTEDLRKLLDNIILEYTINFSPEIENAALKASKIAKENLNFLKKFGPTIEEWLKLHFEAPPEDGGSSVTNKLNVTLLIIIIFSYCKYLI